jgi:hypothetical protein
LENIVATDIDSTTADKSKTVLVVSSDFDYGEKGGRKKGHKHRDKKKKKKHMSHMAIGIIGLKMLYYHFLMKKMATLSLISVILSKISFLVSTLVAIKQLFQPHHEKQEHSKLEVVHIPVQKYNHHDNYDYKRRQNEHRLPKYIPLLKNNFPADIFPTTTTMRSEIANPHQTLSVHHYDFIDSNAISDSNFLK